MLGLYETRGLKVLTDHLGFKLTRFRRMSTFQIDHMADLLLTRFIHCLEQRENLLLLFIE